MVKDFNAFASGNGQPAPHPYLQGLLPDVGRIARKAGALIMRYYGQNYAVEIKDDSSPVTTADQESSEYLVASLSALTPAYAVVSEENDTLADLGLDMPYDAPYWAIDPLDGTREFIDQTGGFCIKIALIAQGRPVLGVVYCPVQNALYTGIEHGLAMKAEGHNPPRAITTKKPENRQSLRVLFNRKHADFELYQEVRMALAQGGLDLPETPHIKPSLPRSLQVAEGLADIHAGTGIRKGSGYVWDLAADDVILTNAGGVIVGVKSGARLDYHYPRSIMPAYLALGDKTLRTKGP